MSLRRHFVFVLAALHLTLAPMAQANAGYGGSVGDAFKGSFINSVVALGLADAQTEIGGIFEGGKNGGEGSLGHGSGAQAFAISAGAGLVVGVSPSAALAVRQCAANPACWGDLAAGLGEAGLGLSGATAGQTFFTVSAGGALAGKLVLSQGDQILGVVDDLGRILRPVTQTPDDLGRFLVTTNDGVTGFLDDGRFVAESIIGGRTCVYSCVIDGTTRYVGITDDVARRGAEHLAQKGIEIEAISGLKNLSRVDARAVEQTLINYFGLGRNGGALFLNKINSISATKNPTAYEQALIRGKEILDSVEYPW